MKKVKKLTFLSATLLLVLTSLCSCEKLIEEIATQEINVGEIEFDINAIVAENGLRADGEYSFEGKENLALDDKTFEGYVSYARFIKAFNLKSVSMQIVSISGEGSYAKDVLISSESLNSDWSLAEYGFGSTYSNDSNLNSFVGKILDAIIEKKTVDISFSGKTDAPENTEITLKLKIGGVLTVQLLNN
jgi:hypothetical protein